ncbi:23S rRNA (adenine(1618)-N(6))-methyltransferase RlmF [Cobetia crustatorum]|uniref:Ribosomal RNA large subunit methyltransferase F n=1 Tax=Cobetia crustatorum TaxID=553385 RepID=A0A558HHZ0_9GAMM|nr:23S rRNA (adenine(1618)-N(6))-methyltransferase RlmF [Cobetia crustatorum]TVU68760.1 23S rRNA (adenine(1618)-N(6))-methyltransferase RlmF [Cobetia crustatorum]
MRSPHRRSPTTSATDHSGVQPAKSGDGSSQARKQTAIKGKQAVVKGELHPRNPHRGRYDMAALVSASPALAPFVIQTPAGSDSISFSDPLAVKALNRALLAHYYDIAHWDIPAGYLCPPIPGRADYLHYLTDLLVEANAGILPEGGRVKALDIGVGANVIYPLLGNRSFGWQMVGSDVSVQAIESARQTVSANPLVHGQIELRLQANQQRHFTGIWAQDERFDLVLCNPPFHASEADMAREAERKWRGLDKSRQQRGAKGSKRGQRGRANTDRHASRSVSPGAAPALNFAGQAAELWCPGGEEAFVTRMIEESCGFSRQCLWFSSLVAHSASLPAIKRALANSGASEVKVIEMSQGQKISRFVAWSFHSLAQRREWAAEHWQKESAHG